MNYLKYTILYVLIFQLSCLNENKNTNASETKNKTDYKLSDFKVLARLHTKLGEPQPGEWLYEHEEGGQSYSDYCYSKVVCPNSLINKIYVLPVGEFNENEQRLIKNTAEYIGIFFTLKVELLAPISDKEIPAKMKRINFGIEQLLTSYILDSLLIPRLSPNTIGLIALTNKDLYPSESWNFVFGQANLAKRVGVSSFFRFSAAGLDSSTYNKCLERTIKTTTHELCHMFSMKHCRIYECLINGANGMTEADRNPLWLCPECLAKLQWCIRFDLIDRYNKLIDYCDNQKFGKEKEFYLKSKGLMTEK